MLDPFAFLQRPIPEYLTTLLAIDKKGELKKYAKQIEISQLDFVTLVYNSQSIGYFHQIKHREFQPNALRIEPGEAQRAFSNTEGHKISHQGKKFISKISQIFEQRRLVVAHFFFNSDKWHLFYFDQRDHSTDENHWEHGPHIHFVNYLWPGHDPENLWEIFDRPDAGAEGKLHIRFIPRERSKNGA